MSENTQEVTVLTDDQILENSQIVRKKLVDSLIKDGQMPTDTDDKYVLLGALKDMDKQVIDKRRVAIEDKAANSASVVADAVSKISTLLDGDPFKRKGSGEAPVADDSKIPDYTPVPGETAIGITSETFDDFMGKHGKSSKQ